MTTCPRKKRIAVAVPVEDRHKYQGILISECGEQVKDKSRHSVRIVPETGQYSDAYLAAWQKCTQHKQVLGVVEEYNRDAPAAHRIKTISKAPPMPRKEQLPVLQWVAANDRLLDTLHSLFKGRCNVWKVVVGAGERTIKSGASKGDTVPHAHWAMVVFENDEDFMLARMKGGL